MEHDSERAIVEPTTTSSEARGRPGGRSAVERIQRKAASAPAPAGGGGYQSELGQSHGIALGGAPAYGSDPHVQLQAPAGGVGAATAATTTASSIAPRSSR